MRMSPALWIVSTLLPGALAVAAAPAGQRLHSPYDTHVRGYWGKHSMTEPVLQARPARPYAGIKVVVSMKKNWGAVVPKTHKELFNWLASKHIKPTGGPFIRYLYIDMNGQLQLDLGLPVRTPVRGNSRIHSGVLPAGHYAVLVFTGAPDKLVVANAALQDWAARKGISWRSHSSGKGERWDGRVETDVTDPASEPDMNKWRTEVAYLTLETRRR